MKRILLITVLIFIAILAMSCMGTTEISQTNQGNGIYGTCTINGAEYDLELQNGKVTLTISYKGQQYNFYGNYTEENSSTYNLTIDRYNGDLISQIPDELESVSITISNGRVTFSKNLTFNMRDYILDKDSGNSNDSDNSENNNNDNADNTNGDNSNDSNDGNMNDGENGNIDSDNQNGDETNGENKEDNGDLGDNDNSENEDNSNDIVAGEDQSGSSSDETVDKIDPAVCEHKRTKIVGYKKPTCTEDGCTGDKICTLCDTLLLARKTIPHIGHIGGTSTCNKKAICSRCEKEYGEFASHTKLNDATCTEDSICMVCSEILENALGHMGGEATCKDKAVCSRCEKEYGEFASHTKLNDATCTEDSICMVCSEILENALGHMGGEATCKDKAVCTRCEEEYGDFANHTELNEVTCIDDSICSVCFEVIETAKGHTYLNGKICKDCDHIDYYSPYLYEYNEETTNLYDDSFKKEIIGTLIYTEDLLTIEYTTKITERYNITFVGETVDFDNPEINDIDSLEFLGFVKTDDGYLKQEENEITTIKIIGENIGYFEAVTTIEESTKFKDVVLNENKLSYVDDNGNTIIVLKFEDGTFIKAEPTVSITYKYDGKKYNENFYEDGYVTINGTLGIEKWYGVNGEEYEANQKIFIGKNAVLYNKAYTITAYINGEYIKTVYGCDEFSKYILNTDEQVGYEFIGWKVDENIYSENEIVFPEIGMFTAECVYEKTETVAPTINENGMKTVIRHEGMKVIKNEILIPLLSEKNGYEITILKQASILSDGLIQYTNSEYGSYNVTTERLDYYKDDTFEVNIIGEKFTVVTNGITYSGNIERSEEAIRFITEESSEIGKEFNGTVSVYDNGFIRNEITEVADDLTLNKSVSGKTYYGYSKENIILMYTDGENLYIIENDDKEYVGSYLTEDDGKYSVIINNRNIMEFSISSDGNLWYTMDGNTIPIGSLNYEKVMGKYIRGFVPSGEELIINDDGTYVFKYTNIQESGRWLYSESEDKIYLYVDKVNELPIFEYTKDGFGIMS